MSAGLASKPLEAEDGNPGLVFKAALAALRDGRRAALAVVLETEGSTYTRAGTVVLFTDQGHVGWLSGGCLEPEIERRAMQAVDENTLAWMEIDTRDDDALFAGNAVGCRGRQRVVLIPLASLAGIDRVFDPLLRGEGTLELRLHSDGARQWRRGDPPLPPATTSPPVAWEAPRREWQLQWRRAPGVVVLGAGPEAAPLMPLLVDLGWRVEIHEPRARWRERLAAVVPPDQRSGATESSSTDCRTRWTNAPLPDAVLVMHHNFELDRDALEALAATSVPFIGLLGPGRRRDDLFKLLPPEARASLSPRLRSPIGLGLGGRGPEAIALSIAAQLQAWRHGVPEAP